MRVSFGLPVDVQRRPYNLLVPQRKATCGSPLETATGAPRGRRARYVRRSVGRNERNEFQGLLPGLRPQILH